MCGLFFFFSPPSCLLPWNLQTHIPPAPNKSRAEPRSSFTRGFLDRKTEPQTKTAPRVLLPDGKTQIASPFFNLNSVKFINIFKPRHFLLSVFLFFFNCFLKARIEKLMPASIYLGFFPPCFSSSFFFFPRRILK